MNPTELKLRRKSRVLEVAFDDEADAFRNINTADELAAAGSRQ